MIRKPYIGITDFITVDQVREMLHVFTQIFGGLLGRRLMVGVMMSYKTLHGLPTKWMNAFPKKEDIGNIFGFYPLAFNVLHYADYDGVDVLASLDEATYWGGAAMQGLQLDMIWPDPGIVKAYREKHPGIEIIIQGNAKAMEMVGDDPAAFVDRLCNYGDAINYVLLDKSMGKGISMNADVLLPFAWEIKSRLPDLDLVAAGGLGPDTVHFVEPLMREFPETSTDAQGKLRPSGNALDPIDWNMASRYVERMAMLCALCRK